MSSPLHSASSAGASSASHGPSSSGLFALRPASAALQRPAAIDAVSDSAGGSEETPVSRPHGPGLPEAVIWTIGVLVIHFAGAVFTASLLIAGQLVADGAVGMTIDEQAIIAILQDLQMNNAMALIMGEMCVFVLSVVVMAWLRLGHGRARKLGLVRVPARHMALIAATVIPLSLLCGNLHHYTTDLWNHLAAEIPALGIFNGMDVNQMLGPIAASVSFPLLFFAIAVAPAIGEEIVFRGIIGRGLVARYGVAGGMFLTAMLFAAVHIHPAHVLALLPLAFFIHLTYLVTRSFWAPVLMHLLNNGLAAVLLKLGPAIESSPMVDESAMSLPMAALLTGIVGLSAWMLWKSRLEYRHADGSLWSPGYSSVEVPPAACGATASLRPHSNRTFTLAVSAAGLYSIAFVVAIYGIVTGTFALVW